MILLCICQIDSVKENTNFYDILIKNKVNYSGILMKIIFMIIHRVMER
jgi:hypothetical protein